MTLAKGTLEMSKNTKKYDPKIFRLMTILNKLSVEGEVHSRELADEFKVTIRSVQRDLELLNGTGFPLASAEKGTYSFVEGYSLRTASLTAEEASLLAFLNEVAHSLGEKFTESFRTIFKKVLFQGGESPYYAKIPKGTSIDRATPFLKQLEHAVAESKVVTLHYLVKGQEKSFLVDPLKIAFFEGFWYLISRVHHKDWIRNFRLENIKKLEVLDQYFAAPQNLKAMLDQSVSAWFSQRKDIVVTLKVDKEVADYFKEREYYPLQKIIKKEKDGSIVIEAKVGRPMEVIPNILRWLPYVHVIGPKEVRDEVTKRIKAY